jgi:hypothetical protein
MKRFVVACVVVACEALSVPAQAQAPAQTQAEIVVPPGCAAVLAAPEPTTIDGMRDLLLCERLTAASALQRAAAGAREVQAALDAHDSPSRLVWLSVGAAAALALVVGIGGCP